MGRVVVTGMGIVSAIGNNLSENHQGLHLSQTGIGRAKHLDSRFVNEFLFGEVGLSNDELFMRAELKDRKGFTRTELLAITAFKEAVADAGLSRSDVSGSGTALISGTTVGGMVETKAIYGDANTNVKPSEFVNAYRSGAHTLAMAALFGIKGYTDTINTACSSAANAIMLGTRLLKAKRADRVIVGGVDSLSKYTVNGFNALQIFSDELTKPFDEHRKGLNLGEGAAYLVLEREENVGDRRVYGEVRGYGNANDAHHPSSMSPDGVGVRNAMQRALEEAGLEPSDIDCVNAHGTGTVNNDHTEILGFTKIFEKIPPFSSTKAFTGHTLAAAGAVEAVFSLLSIQHGEIYPNLNFNAPISAFGISPQTEIKTGVSVGNVLSNSFGFGGNCTSLVFSKVQ